MTDKTAVKKGWSTAGALFMAIELLLFLASIIGPSLMLLYVTLDLLQAAFNSQGSAGSVVLMLLAMVTAFAGLVTAASTLVVVLSFDSDNFFVPGFQATVPFLAALTFFAVTAAPVAGWIAGL